MSQVQPFFELLRKKTPTALWSQGVKLVRENAVVLIRQTDEVVECRVRESGRPVSTTTTLYPPDDEWDCDCASKVVVCQHVAAVAIGWSQGLSAPIAEEGSVAPAEEVAAIGYAFDVVHTTLRLTRSFVFPDGRGTALSMSLTDRIARGMDDPRALPTHDDLIVDRVFTRKIAGEVPLAHLKTVLRALAGAAHVTLGGEPISVSGAELLPVGRVEDGPGGGVRLLLNLPPGARVLGVGIGRVGGELRALGCTDRFGIQFEKLPIDKTFTPAELGSLAAEILPELGRILELTIATRRLPTRGKRILPRIEFELSHELGALHVMPLLVYGMPAIARVDAGKLVLLKRGIAPERDEAKEQDWILRLRDKLSMVPGRRVRFDGRAAAEFAQRLTRFQAAHEEASVFGEASHRPILSARIDVSSDSIDVAFETEVQGETRRAAASDVLRAYRDGLSIVGLEGGGFAELPADFLDRHGAAIADLIASKAESEGDPKRMLMVSYEAVVDLGLSAPSIEAQVRPLLDAMDNPDGSHVSPQFQGELRAYQGAGASWLGRLGALGQGGVLADDMGLGKTVQVIAMLTGKVLVVCPRSVLSNWEKELRRFRPELALRSYLGANRSLEGEWDVLLTTFAILRNDAEDLRAIEFDVAIIDEAQAIKNPTSQSFRAAIQIRAKARFALSGTPIENRSADLWSLFRFTNPGLLGTLDDFEERFAKPIADGNGEVLARLRRRIRPFLLRRTKSAVLTDLPPRTEGTLSVELSPVERDLYRAVALATRKEVMERLGQGESVLSILEALLRLRQAACHPGLLPGRTESSSSKVVVLSDTLEELVLASHKSLVFSQWTSLLDRIEPHLEARGIPFVRLDGSTRDRGAVVDAFQSADGPPVMLLSLKAGGVGLNLTAADHVFLLDPWWNPAVMAQAADRAHRIGQDRPVNVYNLVSLGTVEERILALAERKKALSTSILGESEVVVSSAVTREELLALLDDVE